MKRLMTDQRGQQLVLVALLLPLLIAVLGLVLDIGVVLVRQRRIQTAADAAATAAGMVLYHQGRATAVDTALYYAAQNGYSNNNPAVSIRIHQPPASGTYAGNAQYIQIEIREQIRPVFAAVVWNGHFTVRGMATAGYSLKALGADLFALKDTACNGYVSLAMNGNQGMIRAVNGVVQVNSPCPNAVSVGNGNIDARTTGAINIVGPSYSSKPNSIFVPPATLNAPPIPDPLAGLPVPGTAGCPPRTGPVNGVYLPGVYAANFNPNFNYPFDGRSGECNSVFYFQGSLSTNSSTITIINGMFYFHTGSLILGGDAKLHGTAPTGGPYAGMLIFLGRNNTGTVYLHGNPVANCSTAAAAVKGIVYAPAGTIVVQGTSDQCYAGALLGWIIEQNGNATTTLVAYPGTLPGTRVTYALVE